jgi:C-terminal processing protease CtpA/Prc
MVVGKERFKRGTGRLDYSVPMPAVMDTYPDEHYVVDDKPIVLLTNCNSISMSEVTSLAAKTLNNAKLIGKRTWGGLCGLIGNEKNTINYSGKIGEPGKTPVYCYCPTLALMTVDDQILEGVGVTPDIEVDFDVVQFEATGKDTQLERALQYIRNGQ